MTKNINKRPGRPSSIDKISLDKIKKLVLSGWTDAQVADFFDLTVTALHIYKSKHIKFFNSLKGWKKIADAKVEKRLYKRATGYKYDEITYEKSKTGGLGAVLDDGEIQTIKHTDTCKAKIVTKQVIPDVTAQIFWLKNRQPKEWRDKREVKHSGETNLNITVNEVDVSERQKLINERFSCTN